MASRYAPGSRISVPHRRASKLQRTLHGAHSVGISADRLARVDALFQSDIDQARVAGVVSAVACRGKLVRLHSQGVMDIDEARPMTDDVIFRIASMTKLITSVAVMMLYEEGLFQLEDPASKYIPELAGMKPHRAYGGRPPASETVKPADWFLRMPQLLGPRTAQRLT